MSGSSIGLHSLSPKCQVGRCSSEHHELKYQEGHDHSIPPRSVSTIELLVELTYCGVSPPTGKTSKINNELELDLPVMLKTPLGPLAFTPEALKSWGHAHLDNSKRTEHFHDQLREWKKTKVKLQKVLSQAYEETSMLKQHVVSNDMTQDHIYALHNQVKHTAKCICEASQGMDHLIDIVLKQMMLNVDVVRDFGTVLHSIPFDALSVQDLYHSIHSFYVGLIE